MITIRKLLSLLGCVLAFLVFPVISGTTADFIALHTGAPHHASLEGVPSTFSHHCPGHDCVAVGEVKPASALALLTTPTILPVDNSHHVADVFFNRNTPASLWQNKNTTDYWPEWYLLAQVGSGPALVMPHQIRTPQNHGELHILATMQVGNIQVRAKWGADDASGSFTVLATDNQQGVLRVKDGEKLEAGEYVVTVSVVDEFSYLNTSYEDLSAMAELTIVVESSGLSFAEAKPHVNVTVGIKREGALYTAQVKDEEDANYSLIEAHELFTVDISDSSVGAVVSMVGTLAVASTIMLTIGASRDELSATVVLEIRAYDLLSVGLSDGYIGQTYEGERGKLIDLEVAGGSGNFIYDLVPDILGFSVSDGELSIAEATTGVYTLTMEVTDNELGDEGWLAAMVEATISVGAAFSWLEIAGQLSVLAGTEATLLTVSVVGGASPYFYNLVRSPSALTINDNGVLAQLADETLLTEGYNTVTIVVSDSYEGRTEPGTPNITVMVTVLALWELADSQPGSRATVIVNYPQDDVYRFVATGGDGPYVYSYPSSLGFSVASDSGTLSYDGVSAEVGEFVLTVTVDDESSLTPPAELFLSVGVSAALSAASVDSLQSFIGVMGPVDGFALSGLGGIPPYTFSLLANDNFAFIDGELEITSAYASEATVSVVWVLNDSDSRTPVVSGTITVVITDDLAFTHSSPMVNVTIGELAVGAIYTAQVNVGGSVAYQQLGEHEAFTVSVSDSSSGALVYMLSDLSAEITVTLTIQAENDEEKATLALEVRAYKELSVDAVDSVLTTYVGEMGVLGDIKAGGGSGDFGYDLGPEVTGFAVRDDGTLLITEAATVGVYTVMVAVSDNKLGDDGWVAATAVATVSVGGSFSLLAIVDRLALVSGKDGEVLLTVPVEGGKPPYRISMQDLDSGLSVSWSLGSMLEVTRDGDLSLGNNVGTVIIADSYDGPTTPGTPAVTALLTVFGVGNFGELSPLLVTATMGMPDMLASLSVAGGTSAKVYTLSVAVDGFSLSPLGVLSLSLGAKAGSYTLTVLVSDETAGVMQAARYSLLVEVLARLQLFGAPLLTVTTGEGSSVYEFSSDGGYGEHTYMLENVGEDFGFEFSGATLLWSGVGEGYYTLSVLVSDESPQAQESRVLVTVLIIESSGDISGLRFAIDEVRLLVTVDVPGGVILTVAASGGEGDYSYSQIGTHTAFTVLSAGGVDAAVTVSMIGELSQVGDLTLTIVVMDSTDDATATLNVIVASYEALSLRLSAGFAARSYMGEAGKLGDLEVAGGSGDYHYSWFLPAGFSDTDGELSIQGTVAVGIYTLTVIVSDSELGGGWVAAAEATVSVGAAFALVDGARQLSIFVADAQGAKLLTLRGEGGEPPYTYSLVMAPPGLTVSLLGGDGILSWLSGKELPGGNNTVVIAISDNYVGPTEPGTPNITITVTILAVLPLADSKPGARVTVIVNESDESVYHFVVMGGDGDYDYSYTPSLGFTLVGDSGRLSYDGVSGEVGEVVLTVTVNDQSSLTLPAELLLSVGISAALSVGLSDEAREGVARYVGMTGFLAEVELFGVGGIPPYTFALLASENFAIDDNGQNLRLINGLISAQTVSVVWLLEDSDRERTPAVTGTVYVEIRDDLAFVETSAVVNVMAGEKAEGVIYTAQTEDDEHVAYRQIGEHSSFTVDVSNARAGALVSMLSILAAETTVTLTIAVFAGDASATMTLEVRAYDELSATLADGFMGQIYQGEISELGSIETAGGSGHYGYALLSLVSGFAVSAGVLAIDGLVAQGVYTLTMLVADEELSDLVWPVATVVATVSVAAGFDLVETTRQVSVLVQGAVGVTLLTLRGIGGELPYTYNLVGAPLALTMTLLGDEGILLRTGGDLPAGNNAVVIVASDGYVGPTTPGTPDITVTVTVLAISSLSDKKEGSRATVIVNEPEEEIYRFTALGGDGRYVYNYTPSLGFTVASDSGWLSYDGVGAEVGEVVLTVWVDDESSLTPAAKLLLTVEVAAVLSAVWTPRVGGLVSVTGPLLGAELSAIGGIPPYTFSLLANENFAIDENGDNFRVTKALTSVQTLSVVWLLEDSDRERTPAVLGTITVEVTDDFAFAETAPVVNVTVGKKAEHAIYIARAVNINNAQYAPVGQHPSFTVAVEATAAVVSMTSALSEVMTATLTIEAMGGGERVAVTLEIRAYETLSASLLTNTVLQTYEGETGAFNRIDVAGGSGDYGYVLSPSVPGFAVSDGVLSIRDNVTVGSYSLTVIVADKELRDYGWRAATTQLTVSVGTALSLSAIEPRTILRHWQADEVLLTIQVVGGKLPYTLSVHSLASGLTILASDKAGIWDVVHSGNLSAGDNVGMFIINDSYDAPTSPGTPAVTAVLTIVGVDSASLLSPTILSPVQSDFAGAVVTLSVVDGLGETIYRLRGDSSVFALSANVLLMTASHRGHQQAATLSATVQINQGDEELLITIDVTVSTALSLLSPWSLVRVAADFTGLLATLSISGGLVGDAVYSVFAEESESYHITMIGNMVSLQAQATEEITVLLTMHAWRSSEMAIRPATVLIYAPLIFPDLLTPLTITTGVSGEIALWQAEGGSPSKTYTIFAGGDDNFTLTGGTLAVNDKARRGMYTIRAQVIDDSLIPATATAMVTVRVLEPLSLANPPIVLTALAEAVTILYTFVAEGGADHKTYTLISGHTVGTVVYFGVVGGTLSMFAESKPGEYTLQIQVSDDSPSPQMATATVTVEAQKPNKFEIKIVDRITEVPATYNSSVLVLRPEGGSGIATYTIVSGAEYGFSVNQEGIVNLSVMVDQVTVLTVEVLAVRNEPSNTVTLEVNVRTPLQALVQGVGGFPNLLVGSFMQDIVARITIAGGNGAVGVELLDNGGVFDLVEDPDNTDVDNPGRLWHLSRLGGSLTAGGLTLTLRIRDEDVSEGLLPPTDDFIVINGVLWSAKLAADFAHTTYVGEQGELGQVLASGGTEDAYTLMPPVAGFGVSPHGDITINATTTGLYTLTVLVTNSLVELVATTAATVAVLPGLSVVTPQSQITLLAGDTGESVMISLWVAGGESPYTVTVQGNLWSVGFAWAGMGSAARPVTLYRLANSDGLTAGVYTAQVIFDDRYDGPTTPGTAPVTAGVTLWVVATMYFESLVMTIEAFVGRPDNRLHTFAAVGGIAPTYKIVDGDSDNHFSLSANGELYLVAEDEGAEGIYTLAVEATDIEPPQKATVWATVNVQNVPQRIYVIGGENRLGAGVTVVASVVYINDGTADGWQRGVTLSQLTRQQHAAVVFRHRMYVVGGKDLGDAAIWSSNNGIVWQPMNAPFGERYNHRAVLHNDELVVLGGRNGDDNLASDVWSYDGRQWRQKTADGFVGREDFVALSRGGILYALGGVGRNDVWASSDGAAWTRLPMMGDLPAWGVGGLQGVVKDGKMIVYGNGQIAESTDGIFWQVATSESSSRYGGVALYKKSEEVAVSLYHFGGTDYAADGDGPVAQFVSSDDGQNWAEVGFADGFDVSPLARWKFGDLLVFPPDPVSVSAPPPLTMFAPATITAFAPATITAFKTVSLLSLTAYFGDLPHRYFLVEGNSEGYFSLDEDDGRLMMVGAPKVGLYKLVIQVRDGRAARVKITTAIFVNGQQLRLGDVFIAGSYSSGNNRDRSAVGRNRGTEGSWGINWGQDDDPPFNGVSGDLRLGRMEYYQEKLWVFGGHSATRYGEVSGSGAEVWRSTNGFDWELQTDAGMPALVEAHASAVHNDQVYVVGGRTPATQLNDSIPGQPYVWAFNGEEWTDIGQNFPPPFALADAAMVSHNGALYVSGGYTLRYNNKAEKNVWRSDDDGYHWELVGQLSVGVWGHTMLSDGERMYVIQGSEGGNNSYSGVWSSMDGSEWSLESQGGSQGLPAAFWANGVAYQGNLLVVGGFGLSKVWRSDDGGKSWGIVGDGELFNRSAHMMAVVDFPLARPEVKVPPPYWPKQNLLTSLPRDFTGVAGVLQAAGGDGDYTYSLLNAEGFSVDENGLLRVTTTLAPGTQKSFLARVDSADQSAFLQLVFSVLDEKLNVGDMFVVGGDGGNDVWRSTDGGVTWDKVITSPTSQVTLPSLLDYHTVLWHENELVVFADDTYVSGDGGVTWTTIGAPSNQHIGNAAAVSYDNDLFIIGGGHDGSIGSPFYSDKVYRYQVDVRGQGQWRSSIAPTHHLDPNYCASRKALARDDGVYLMGGRCGSNSGYQADIADHVVIGGRSEFSNGVWSSLNGTKWSFLGTTPFTRRLGFAFLETNGWMYVIGGLDEILDNHADSPEVAEGEIADKYETLDEVWRSRDGVKWEKVPRTGARFTPRYGHGGAVDAEGNLVIFGGALYNYTRIKGNHLGVTETAGPFGDVWKSGDGKIWTRYETNLPARADQGSYFMTYIPGKATPVPLLSASDVVDKVPYGYQGEVARLYGVGGVIGSPLVYQLLSGSEQGFAIEEDTGILSLDTVLSGVAGSVVQASVAVIRQDAPSAGSQIVVVAVSVSAPIALSYSNTAPGFPTVLVGNFGRFLTGLEIIGGQDPIGYEIIGDPGIFEIDLLSSENNRRFDLSRRAEELVAGKTTLTMRIRDVYVDNGLSPAATDLKITIWAVPLKAQLAADFVDQTFVGEYGVLGQISAVVDEYNRFALNPPISGFTIDEYSGVITVSNVAMMTYTLSVEVNNASANQAAVLVATVRVGEALAWDSVPRMSILANSWPGETLAVLSVVGGQPPYTYTALSLPPGVSVLFGVDTLTLKRVSLELAVGDNVAILHVADAYAGPTAPGTPAQMAIITMIAEENLLLIPPEVLSSVPTDFSGAVATLSLASTLIADHYELLGDSPVFGFSSNVLLLTASNRGNVMAATVMATVRALRGSEVSAVTVSVLISAALVLSLPLNLTTVAADFDGILATLSAFGGFAGDTMYSITAAASDDYQLFLNENVLSLRAQVTVDTTIIITAYAQRNNEQSKAVYMTVLLIPESTKVAVSDEVETTRIVQWTVYAELPAWVVAPWQPIMRTGHIDHGLYKLPRPKGLSPLQVSFLSG